MGRMLQVIAPTGVVAHRERAAERRFGDAGSIPACENPYLRQHLSIEFSRRAVEFGLSVKRETASGFKSCAIGRPMDSHLVSCPSRLWRLNVREKHHCLFHEACVLCWRIRPSSS